jgi:hypothetical protein
MTALAPNPNGVPVYLANLPRWLLWRIEQRISRKTGETEETKPPISYHTSKHCDVTDPRNWTDFTNVQSALGRSRAWDGFGFALGEIADLGENIIGLDLDNCLNEEGALLDWAMAFLVAMASYTEYSPGGVGLKCLARIRIADLPEARIALNIPEGEQNQARTKTFGERANGGHTPGAQLFLARRYFTVTGRHWHASPEDVTLLTLGQIAQLGHLFGPKEQRSTPGQRNPADDDETEPDEATLRDKLGAEFVRNPRLKERWEGGSQGLSDTTRSARDMSALAMLVAANFAKGEIRAALRLFEHGKLAEEEQDPKHGAYYFEQMWARTKATPHIEPEVPPEWDARHPLAEEVPPDSTTTTVRVEPVDCFTTYDNSPAEVTADEAPPALWPFIQDTAERMGVATSSVTLAALVTCSAVISDEWRLQPKRHDYTWTENARLWGAIVGPPSILKTPVIKACTEPIDRLEIKAHEQWKEDMARYEILHDEWKAAGDKSTPEPQQPKKPRYLVESTTIEALQEVLRDDKDARNIAPAKKVLVRQDELGEWIANLDRYSGGRTGGDRGAYLRLFNGGRFSVDRIGRGSFNSSSWSGCLLGGVQPEPIQRIAAQSVDDGLLQRFSYDVPPPHPGDGADRSPNRAALDRYHQLIPKLAALHPASTPEHRPNYVALHADAHAYRESIEGLAGSVAAMPDTSSRLQSALGKWPGLFARLCLTCHLIDVADARAHGNLGPPLDVVPTATAARVARYMRRILLPHLLRADTLMFATVQTSHAKWIAGHILAKRLDRITTRDIMRSYGALSAPEARDELNSVMASLVAIGWVDPEPPRNTLVPVSAWRVNPLVHVRFAARAESERAARAQRAKETREHLQAHAAQKAAGSQPP